MVEVPMKNDEEQMEIVSWPMLLPKDLMIALLNSGYKQMLMGSLNERLAYWEQAVLDFPEEYNNIDMTNSAPVSVYGDEVNIFRCQTMVLHWQATLNPKRGDSLLSRFLVAIVPSTKYWIATWMDWHVEIQVQKLALTFDFPR